MPLNLNFLTCKMGVNGLLGASQKIEDEQVDCKLPSSGILVSSKKRSLESFTSINIEHTLGAWTCAVAIHGRFTSFLVLSDLFFTLLSE